MSANEVVAALSAMKWWRRCPLRGGGGVVRYEVVRRCRYEVVAALLRCEVVAALSAGEVVAALSAARWWRRCPLRGGGGGVRYEVVAAVSATRWWRRCPLRGDGGGVRYEVVVAVSLRGGGGGVRNEVVAAVVRYEVVAALSAMRWWRRCPL